MYVFGGVRSGILWNTVKGAEEILYAVLRDKVHDTRVFTCRYSVNVK